MINAGIIIGLEGQHRPNFSRVYTSVKIDTCSAPAIFIKMIDTAQLGL
jgi:hypothetical protein